MQTQITTGLGKGPTQLAAFAAALLAAGVANYKLVPIVVGRRYTGQSACALALAVNQSAPWEAQ